MSSGGDGCLPHTDALFLNWCACMANVYCCFIAVVSCNRLEIGAGIRTTAL